MILFLDNCPILILFIYGLAAPNISFVLWLNLPVFLGLFSIFVDLWSFIDQFPENSYELYIN